MTKLVASQRRPLKLKPTRANAGVQARYQHALIKWIDALSKSVLYWVRAQYRATPPEIAEDASPARELQSAMSSLATRWQKRFNELAPTLADIFANGASATTDTQMMSALRGAGFTVKFKMTRTQNDVLQAVSAENVQLIKSIPQEYLTQVQGSVMRSVASGKDLQQLTREIRSHGAVTRRRAEFIARDQTNKASASLQAARCDELGLETGMWKHSNAGAHPRPSHVAADGTVYNIKQGCYIDGEWIKPGEKPNCRCTVQIIIPGFND